MTCPHCLFCIRRPAGLQCNDPESFSYQKALNRDPFADARRAVASDCADIRFDHGVSVSMERNRIHGSGNAVVPQIPELIGNAILASIREAA